MFNRFKSLIIAMVATLAITSCSESELFTQIPEGTVEFTVNMPADGISTRAFGDGLSATSLAYAVYDDEGEFIQKGTASFKKGELTTKVSLQLTNGVTYKVAFFAYYNSNSVYTFDAESKIVTVNYTKMATTRNATKDYDCFYKTEEIQVAGPTQKQVTLIRPMAQINWGTNDLTNPSALKEYGESNGKANIRTKFIGKAYNTLNVIDGTVTNEVEVATQSTTNPIETSYGTFPGGESYDYINMMYVLVPQDKSYLIDAKLNIHKGGSSNVTYTVEVPNVPVQANYRTNIYGSLLTTTVDITVEKNNNWNTPDNNKELWEGNIVTPTADAEGNYVITSSAELAGIAKMVNSGNNLLGKIVTLANDLDLNNIEWTPIGSLEHQFCGSFDGGNNTIKNLKIDLTGKPYIHTGLFGYASGYNSGEYASIKNLTIDGVNINTLGASTLSSTYGDNIGTAALVGAPINHHIENITVKNATLKSHRRTGAIAGYNYAFITNCHVENAEVYVELENMGNGTYDNGDKAGAIAGFNAYGMTDLELKGNSATNVKVSAFRDCGGLFGSIAGQVKYTGNSITNAEIIANGKNADNTSNESKNFGKIVGRQDKSGETGPVDGGNNVAGDDVKVYALTTVSTTEQLSTAIAAGGSINIASGSTITIPQNTALVMNEPVFINIPQNSTIDLGANSLTVNSSVNISGGGTVTMSKIQGIEVAESGSLTIEGSTITNTNSNDLTQNTGVPSAITNNGGDIVINNAAISVESTKFITINNNSHIFPRAIQNNAGNMTVNGGTFKAHAGAAIINNATALSPSRQNANLTINGGTFINNHSGNYVIVCNGSHGKTVVNGGTFVGYFGCVRADGGCEIEINDGVFITNGTGNTYHAIVENADDSYSKPSKVTVNGGKFWSTNSTLSCHNNNSIVINGGMFKAINDTKALVNGTKSEINVSETYTVPGYESPITCTYTIEVK